MVPLSITIAFIYGVIGLIGKDYDMPVAVLSSLSLKLDAYKAQCEVAAAQSAELARSVEAARLALRVQQENAEGGALGGFDGEIEYEDKLRKSGRTKGKHGISMGPRK
jgi:hypothetical protein